MRDLLQRVQRALPQVVEWIDQLHAKHLPASSPPSKIVAWSQAGWFPVSLLEDARAVTLPTIPFPPVSDYGLPEFESLAAMPMAGITFRNMYFVHEAHGSADAVHFHELVHVVQWQTLGPIAFLSAYALGILQCGYAESPFEAMADKLQQQFESQATPMQLLGVIQQHALSARDAAAQVYRDHGLELGG